MGNKLFIMNFHNKQIGFIEQVDNIYIQYLNNKYTEYSKLPPILRDIAPEPTQFPEANEVLEYYKLEKYDMWEYLKRSNGIKNTRDVWFLSEPIGEVWFPLISGMSRHLSFNSLFKQGDSFIIQLNGFIYVNHHSMPLFPDCILPYLQQQSGRYSTTKGFVYDLIDKPSTRGLLGRMVCNFPESNQD